MSDRSMSRGRSPTPARTPPGANGRSRSRSDSRSPRRSPSPALERTNGARHTRSRSPSRVRTRSPSRARSYRARSYSRSPLPSRSRSPPGPRSSKIVIEKLTKNVQKDHLREIFGSYGDIAELEMPMNKQFMTNKGLAYVVYYTPDGAESAIAHMHEAQLDGAMINVSIVLPRRRFSRSPPPRRPPPDRFGEPGRFRGGPLGGPPGRAPDRAFGRGPPMRPSPPFRDGRPRSRSPPRGYRGGGGGGRGGGYRDRYDDRRNYRPRSYTPSRSRSPPPRRRRSPSYGSRSPPPRRMDYSPRGGGRRSPSYDRYASRSLSRTRR